MLKILAVYGTSYGHTALVVQRMARVLTDAGHSVTVTRGDRTIAADAPAQFDACLVAASVLYGRYQRYIRRFVRRHAALLNARPSAFVSVCGAAAGHSDAEQRQARRYADRFLRETGWKPRARISVGGEMAYTRYGPITRWIIRSISRRNGGPTDTSRDYDATDWPAVEEFARGFAAIVSAAAPVPAAAAGASRTGGGA
jgi:menaquinone-dependent protoporphyrinogen oxidase